VKDALAAGALAITTSTAAMNAVDRTKAGVAGGVLSTSRMIGAEGARETVRA